MELSWLLSALLGREAEQHVRGRMAGAESAIVRAMAARGLTPWDASPREVVRDALWRLWKAAVRYGPAAGIFRAAQEEKVLDLVTQRLEAGADLADWVRATREAAVEQMF